MRSQVQSYHPATFEESRCGGLRTFAGPTAQLVLATDQGDEDQGHGMAGGAPVMITKVPSGYDVT